MAATTPKRSTRAAGSGCKPPGPYPTYGHSSRARKWMPPALPDFATAPGLTGYRYRESPRLCNPKQTMKTGLYPAPHCLFAFTPIYTRVSLACKWHRSDIHTAQNDPVIFSHLQPLTTSQKATYRAILTLLTGVSTAKVTHLIAQSRSVVLKTGMSRDHLQHLHPFMVTYTLTPCFTFTLTPPLKGVSVSEGIVIWTFNA
jgi:hypothetical protein